MFYIPQQWIMRKNINDFRELLSMKFCVIAMNGILHDEINKKTIRRHTRRSQV